MARKKRKPNRQKLLARKFKSGRKFTKKEVRQVAKKLNIKPARAKQVTKRYAKKNQSFNPFKIAASHPASKKAPKKHPPMRNLPPYKPPNLKIDKGSTTGGGNKLPSLNVPDMQDHIDTTQNNNTLKNETTVGRIGDTGNLDKIGEGVDTLADDTSRDIREQVVRYDDSAYMNTISNLLSDLTDYQSKANDYSTQLNELGRKFEDYKGKDAGSFRNNQLKMVGSNNARGVRLRRSRNKNLFALGTGQFNRKNRGKNLAIGNVNL